MRTRLSTTLIVLSCLFVSGAQVAQAQTSVLDNSGTLTTPDPLNPRGSTYFAKSYAVALTAGQNYKFIVQAVAPFQAWPGDDSYMYILNSSGSIVAQDDDSGSGIQHNSVYTYWGAALINYTPSVSGTYTVIATTYAANITMPFKVTVDNMSSTPTPTTGVPNVQLTPRVPELRRTQVVAACHQNQPTAFVTVIPAHRQTVPSVCLPRQLG